MLSSLHGRAKSNCNHIVMKRIALVVMLSSGVVVCGVSDAESSLPAENGKKEPKLGLINDLSVALGVDVSDLMSVEAPSRRA